MPDDELDVRCRQTIGDRDSLLRVAAVVPDLDADLLAENSATGVEVFDGLSDAVLAL